MANIIGGGGTGTVDPTKDIQLNKQNPLIDLTDSVNGSNVRWSKQDALSIAALQNDVTRLGSNSFALSFDGVNDTVSVANEANFDFEYNNPFSIEAWVDTTATTDNAIFSKKTGGNNPGYVFSFVAGVLDMILVGGTGGNFIEVKGGTTIPSGWQYVVMTYDGSGLASGVNLYVNGSIEAMTVVSDTLSSNSMLNNNTPYIGSFDNTFSFFSGSMDEIRVYSKELTPTEVSTHYNSGSGQHGSPEANLVAGWHCNEGSGTSLADYSGNVNNGTLLFGTTWTTGKVPVASAIVTTDIVQSKDGGASNEWGIQIFGHGSGRSILDGKACLKYVPRATSATTFADTIIGVDTSSAVTVTLASADAVQGHLVIVKDETGNAGTNAITIDTEGTELIDGSASATINTNYGVLRLYSDGTNWFTI